MPELFVTQVFKLLLGMINFIGVCMCLICVEYFYQRMTREEVKNALPEMVMFAKTEEERNHYKKLQTIETDSEFDQMAKDHIAKSEIKNDYRSNAKTKAR